MPTAPRDLARRLRDDGDVVLGWCSIPSTITAEILARQGYDALVVDQQHGFVDYAAALPMLQAIGPDTATLCRVPWLDPGTIGRALDAGFVGIICPMINSRTEAEALVRACRYAPAGARSYGPTRARRTLGADYAAIAPSVSLAFAMIETAEAVDALDEILSVDGLDGVYVGPADLALSLGFAPTLASKDEPVVRAVATILRAAKAHGKPVGIHCGSPAGARAMLDQGFDYVALSTDVRQFETIVADQLAEVRRGPRPAGDAGQY